MDKHLASEMNEVISEAYLLGSPNDEFVEIIYYFQNLDFIKFFLEYCVQSLNSLSKYLNYISCYILIQIEA